MPPSLPGEPDPAHVRVPAEDRRSAPPEVTVHRRAVLPVALLAAALAACSAPEPSGASGAAPATQLAEPDHTVLSANSTAKLGTVVIDGLGWTLYRCDADSATPSRSACLGSCAEQWPPVLMQAGHTGLRRDRPRGGRHGRPRRRPPAGDDRRVAGVPARERLPAGLRRRTGRAGPVVRRHPTGRKASQQTDAGLTRAPHCDHARPRRRPAAGPQLLLPGHHRELRRARAGRGGRGVRRHRAPRRELLGRTAGGPRRRVDAGDPRHPRGAAGRSRVRHRLVRHPRRRPAGQGADDLPDGPDVRRAARQRGPDRA